MTQNQHHPHFGHTLADHFMDHHRHPLSLHGPVVHVKAIIKKVEEDVQNNHGDWHQHFIVQGIQVIDIDGADKSVVTDEAFCAIRYGDNLGLKERISGLKEGEEIELKGEYIDKNHALKGIGNPGDPVIHFTHHPVGFVNYLGKHYE
ncbi:hypothetical protein KHA94_04415 [Bacillus sp. FJAT-49705]|uniref:Uncharacterized protein n=1 Tax=Cytobacillus citreus TaxID=2833586 RepID=A0ABS5NNT9_9BACI|nr:hypothetical protein [Cytobacillus citreus]MBS4189463.1 hypothetical protein [Cytobacillus citreus]